MTTIPDLSPCAHLPIPSVNLLSVGWLTSDDDFARGAVPLDFFRKLCELLQDPWQPVETATAICRLCQFDPAHNKTNIFVPAGGAIYVAPALVAHFVAAHWYRPPDVFINGVLECPPMKSLEYKKALLANGAREIVRLSSQGGLPPRLSRSTIDDLRRLGLSIADDPFFPPTHVAYPAGYILCKPSSSAGNSLPGMTCHFTNHTGQDDESDAPAMNIFYLGGNWWCEVHQWIPGPGPGDFRRSFESEADLVAEAQRYYFGASEDFEALRRRHDRA